MKKYHTSQKSNGNAENYRFPITQYPSIFLNIWVSSTHPVGRPNLTTRQSFLNSLHYCHSEGILKFKCPSGILNEWVKKLSKYAEWTNMTEKLHDVRILNEVNFRATYYFVYKINHHQLIALKLRMHVSSCRLP